MMKAIFFDLFFTLITPDYDDTPIEANMVLYKRAQELGIYAVLFTDVQEALRLLG